MDRFEQLTHDQEAAIGVRPMRLFDLDAVPCSLDTLAFRVEKQKGATEQKVIDLTLRVEPFTIDLASSVDPAVRKLLFTLQNVRPKSLIHLVELNFPIAKQRLVVQRTDTMLADRIIGIGDMLFPDAKIHRLRAKVPKERDDYAFLFVATVTDVGPQQLEYLHAWLTESRFVTFAEEQPALRLDDDDHDDEQPYAH